MGQYYLRDETWALPPAAADSTASKGLGDFQFSIMGPNLKEFPNITHGSILRVHHVMLEEYLNNLTGRVFSPNCVSVMGNVNNSGDDDLQFSGTSVEVSQGDRERVGELKAWWKANFGRVELKLEQLDEEFVRRQRMASLTVRLIEKVYAGVEKYVLRVSDGSACPLTTRGVRTTGANSEVSFTSWKDRLACDIFVNGQEHQSTARVGRTIKLSGVLAERDDIFPEGYELKLMPGVGTCELVDKASQESASPLEDSMDILLRELPSQDLNSLDNTKEDGGAAAPSRTNQQEERSKDVSPQATTTVHARAINDLYSDCTAPSPMVTRSRSKDSKGFKDQPATSQSTSQRKKAEGLSPAKESGQLQKATRSKGELVRRLKPTLSLLRQEPLSALAKVCLSCQLFQPFLLTTDQESCHICDRKLELAFNVELRVIEGTNSKEYDLGQHVGNYHSAEDYKASVKAQSEVLALIEKTVNQQVNSTDSFLLPQRDP